MEDIKLFLKKKRKKGQKKSEIDIKISLKEKKTTLVYEKILFSTEKVTIRSF